MNGTVTIYGLVDPGSGAVRYVGRTARPLALRAANHGGLGCGVRLQMWVRQLAREGLRPRMVVLAQVEPGSAASMERRYISAYAHAGSGLLNVNHNPKAYRWDPPGPRPWQESASTRMQTLRDIRRASGKGIQP